MQPPLFFRREKPGFIRGLKKDHQTELRDLLHRGEKTSGGCKRLYEITKLLKGY